MPKVIDPINDALKEPPKGGTKASILYREPLRGWLAEARRAKDAGSAVSWEQLRGHLIVAAKTVVESESPMKIRVGGVNRVPTNDEIAVLQGFLSRPNAMNRIREAAKVIVSEMDAEKSSS